MQVPYFKFECSDREIELVTKVLRSGWLTTASMCKQLEESFAHRCQASHALAVNSCTAGLHLALEAIGIGPGDKVVVPSLTFTASAEVIRYLGADPLFVDVDEDHCLMTRAGLAAAYEKNPDIKACVVVHFAGQSAELDGDDGIYTYCQEKGIKLVQDAAHAFPSEDTYGPVGALGDVTCFSFYANKTMTTGEGGMVVTNDSNIAERIKVMRLHGINRDVWDRFTKSNSGWEYDVVAPGYKYNMPDINAAVGVAQLETVDANQVKRQQVAETYQKALSDVRGLRMLKSRVKLHAWHLFPIVLTKDAKIDRDRLIDELKERGIGTSVHYKPLHHMTYYKKAYNLTPDMFPNSEKYWQGCISLPIYPAMTQQQIHYVVDTVIHLLK